MYINEESTGTLNVYNLIGLRLQMAIELVLFFFFAYELGFLTLLGGNVLMIWLFFFD